MATKERIVKFIRKFEGGFVNDADDNGKATNKGITIALFRQYFGSGRTVSDLKSITDEQWMSIFDGEFWNPLHCDLMPQWAADVILDFAFHSGKDRAVKYAQSMCRVSADGVVGRITIDVIRRQDSKKFVEQYCELRRKYLLRISGFDDKNEQLLRIARTAPSQINKNLSRGKNKKYISGWCVRVKTLQRKVLSGEL